MGDLFQSLHYSRYDAMQIERFIIMKPKKLQATLPMFRIELPQTQTQFLFILNELLPVYIRQVKKKGEQLLKCTQHQGFNTKGM